MIAWKSLKWAEMKNRAKFKTGVFPDKGFSHTENVSTPFFERFY